MNSFSISQLAAFSGVKPHTIRVWEQRYKALMPNRSQGNTRYYNNEQLRRLLNIVSLSNADYKVSEISSLSDKSMFKLIEEISEKEFKRSGEEYFILQLISTGMNFDEVNFDKILSHCLLKYGIKRAYIEIIYPMLKRVGIMWTAALIPPAAEHFISNLIRQKLFTVIDSLPTAKDYSDSWLLFLPENEFHEIGLLFSHYLIRQSGRHSVYLGSSVPVDSIREAAKIAAPPNLLFFIAHNVTKDEIQIYINDLSRLFKNKKIFIAGDANHFERITTNKNIKLLYSVENLEQVLRL